MILTSKSFDVLRSELFGGMLTTSQVKSLEFLVKACKDYGLNYPQCAYALATVYHETGLVKGGKLVRTMQPVKESGSLAYLTSKKYYPYIGYGYVQLTWEDNYRRVGKLIGEDLIKYPELALVPEIAAEILICGMARGWFTGVGFYNKRDVHKYDLKSYVAARSIINGTDRAKDVAEYAMVFEKALRS